ncbi:uncharacterized protein PAC_19479 [Phialocephala subalpina]|uniref:Uncharacterized protein n=1 Tax=Phialocephala subalpina TaxID=576137 RepID=A0A1L7XX65_9HELO|nr:uncharacterized protein PAC_19479 [Phialocephala subalpina]
MAFLRGLQTRSTAVGTKNQPPFIKLSSQDDTPTLASTASRLDDPICLGRPTRKSTFQTIDFCVVFGSFACLAIAISMVTPRLSLAWQLGFDNQIIVIGFLLGIMNLALKKLTPTLLLLIEARWGHSTLQNYDAILRNTLSAPHTGVIWRLSIFFFLLLPLVLSVGYKRFTGGTSSNVIANPFSGRYGLAAPPLGDYNAMNNSVYFSINANVPFMAASANDSIPPPIIPTAYGSNTLLLDNSSAAILDMPLPGYVSSIQQSLAGSDFWKVSATVNASVARYNSSVETLRNKSDPFFNNTLKAANAGGQKFATFFEFNAWALGWLPGKPTVQDGHFVLVGHYFWNDIFWDDYISNPADPKFISFQSKARMFNMRRERCAGTWQINRTAVVLLNGFCSGIPTNQTAIASFQEIPFPLDTLPVLAHSIESYSADRKKSPWLLPAFATSVATSYWARWLFMLSGIKEEGEFDSELNYPPRDEYIESTTTTLDATWLLYVLLAVQPVLTLLMFLFSALLYHTPIGNGFGVVAIMSGIDKDSLNLLSGAAFSGDLEKPVKLNISVVNKADDIDGKGIATSQLGQINYTIDGSSDDRQRIEQQRVYV